MDKISQINMIRALRRSLIHLIPILMVGAFALVLQSLPLAFYQDFIHHFCGGILYSFFEILHNVTFNVMSIIFIVFFGYYMGESKNEINVIGDDRIGTMIVSLSSFFVAVGVSGESLSAYGPKGMFLAILTTIFATELYKFLRRFGRKKNLLSDGLDLELASSLRRILPLTMTLLVIVVLDYVITRLSGQETLHNALAAAMTWLFSKLGTGFLSSVVFVLSSSLLWFFGIHGSDALETVAGNVFYEMGSATEEAMRGAGALPRTALNIFVLMGGCGTAITLLIAMMIFSKRKSSKNLIKMASFPAVFNVSEILVYGVPIIFNPAFFIPFLCVPLLSLITSYIAIQTGLVPLPTQSVEWTTPILYSGYVATGSIRGTLLQVFNLVMGVMIYAPFVKLNEISQRNATKRTYEQMVRELQSAEADNRQISLTDSAHSYRWIAKSMAAELKEGMSKNELELFYQPQCDVNGKVIGAEALFRWRHPLIGMVYPPLAFKLAEECHFLEDLEKWVVKRCFEDVSSFQNEPMMKDLKTSFNVTGTSIQSEEFGKFLDEMAEEYDVASMHMCLEVTEQAALRLDDALHEKFAHFCEKGYLLAVDDFSMGNTSVQYLTGGNFSLIKLDGGIVRQIIDNPRTYDIIVSIIHLANKLQLDILAEFVCNEEIKNKLKEAGCYQYQGGYYSMAVPKESYVESLRIAALKNEQVIS